MLIALPDVSRTAIVCMSAAMLSIKILSSCGGLLCRGLVRQSVAAWQLLEVAKDASRTSCMCQK